MTNPRVLISPLPVGRAVRYVADWLAQPNARFLTPGPRHLDNTVRDVHAPINPANRRHVR